MSYEHVFDELQIATDPFALCELRGACDLGLGREASATLHYILSGEGEITFHDRRPLRIKRGSLVLIPALQSHALRSYGSLSDPIPECKPAELNLARLISNGALGSSGNGRLTALCARVRVGLRGVDDLIDFVREPLVAHVTTESRMKSALLSLIDEVSNPDLGSRAMIRAILLQCMIEMLRKRLAAQDRALHWMVALRDPTVWDALRHMLDAPGDAHTVETLAQHVGMSRSAFAKRFAEAYGSGPMELLRDLRMRAASGLLRDTELPVKRIAEKVGFSSRTAFSRTFEGKTGLSPRAFRQIERSKRQD